MIHPVSLLSILRKKILKYDKPISNVGSQSSWTEKQQVTVNRQKKSAAASMENNAAIVFSEALFQAHNPESTLATNLLKRLSPTPE